MVLYTILVLITILSVLSLLAIFAIFKRAKKDKPASPSSYTPSAPVPNKGLGLAMIPSAILIILLPVAALLIPQYLSGATIAATILLVALWIWLLPVLITLDSVRQKRIVIGEAKEERTTVQPANAAQSPYHILSPQLLALMKKNDSSELQEGDSIHLKLSVLVINPFSFLLSGGLSNSAKRFEAINEGVLFYDSLFGLNHSLFSSFSGNYTIALFNPNTADPIKAAIHINKKSRTRPDSLGDSLLSASMMTNRPHYCAITQGPVTIGMVKYNKILQPIVCSNTISTALQLQQVAQKLHVPILVSQDFFNESAAQEKYQIRTVGSLREQNSKKIIHTYEVLNGYPLRRVEKLVENRKIFEEGCAAREGGDTNTAYSKFSYVLAHDPSDTLAQYFLDITRQRLPLFSSD